MKKQRLLRIGALSSTPVTSSPGVVRPDPGLGQASATLALTAPSSTSGWGNYDNDNWPDGSFQFYAGTAAWNTPPPSGTHSRSAAKVAELLTIGTKPANIVVDAGSSPNAFGHSSHAVCWNSSTDPSFVIDQTGVSGVYIAGSVEGLSVKIPELAIPGQDGFDYHLGVIDQTAGKEWAFFKVASKPSGGGTITCEVAGRSDIGDASGTGFTSPAPAFGFSTQAATTITAGCIRGEELEAGEINHALFGVVNGSSRSGVHVPPSARTDLYGTETNKIELGNRFVLNLSETQIDALSIAPWEKIVYKALSNYGCIICDGGGTPGAWVRFQYVSVDSYGPFGQTDPLITYAAAHDASTSTINFSSGNWVYSFTNLGSSFWTTNLKVAPLP